MDDGDRHTILFLDIFGVPEEPPAIELSIKAQPVNCTTGLSPEALAGTPCAAQLFEEFRQAEDGTFVGCLHTRVNDWFGVSPVTMGHDEEGEQVFDINFPNVPSLRGDEFFTIASQWIFLSDGTPADCDALTYDSTCENTHGCILAVGPVRPREPTAEDELEPGRVIIDGQDARWLCIYTTPDGPGLVHPELCDGRDNDCNGVVDDAPMCMPENDDEPEPEPEGQPMSECEDSRDCDILNPLCIAGTCRECEAGVLECDLRAQPVCDASGVCRGCANDDECAHGASCDVTTGVCLECTTDIDCPAHQPFCSPTNQGEACNPLLSGQCGDGQSCLNSGRCGGCASDEQCPTNTPLCNLASGLCEGCVSNSDCPENMSCLENQCRECATPGFQYGQCPQTSAPICDGETFSCRPCENSGECGDGGVCYLGQCKGCNPMTNEGCEGTNQICDPNFLSCSPCERDEQCQRFFPNQPICSEQSGQCEVCETSTNEGCTEESPVCRINNGTPECQPCQENQDCAHNDGAVCDGGRCVVCADDVDCQDGLRCATINGARACAACDPDAPVGANGCIGDTAYCLPSGECASCRTNADCPNRTPICGNGYQCRGCLADVECIFEGLVCGDGVCTLCDASRSNPDDPNVDFGCTEESPNCLFGGVRCTQ